MNNNNECKDYSVYYCDYLYDCMDQIPESVLEHFSACENCKAEMANLKRELDKPVTTEELARNAAIGSIILTIGAFKASLLLMAAALIGVFAVKNKDSIADQFDNLKNKAAEAASIVKPALGDIRQRASQTAKAVRHSIASGDYAQATKTMWTAIKLEWSLAITKLRENWAKFRTVWIKSVTFMQVWGVKIWDYMVQSWIVSISFFKRVWVSTIANLFINGFLYSTNVFRTV